MKKRNSKALAQMRHARRRAAERYGLNLNKDQLQKMVKQIQTGNAVLIEKQSNRCSMWWVRHEDKCCRVVYDKNRKTIVTFLPAKEARLRPPLKEEVPAKQTPTEPVSTENFVVERLGPKSWEDRKVEAPETQSAEQQLWVELTKAQRRIDELTTQETAARKYAFGHGFICGLAFAIITSALFEILEYWIRAGSVHFP